MPRWVVLHATAMTPPVLDWHRFASIHLDVVPTALIALAGVIYLSGARRVNRLDPGVHWSTKRTVAFVFGLFVTFLAVDSFIARYSQVLFYDHMIQHLMFVMVAAPLFAMGAPAELLERATTGRTHGLVVRGLGSRVAEIVAHPIVDFGLYAVLIPLAHLTGLFNVALIHPAVNYGEHLAFLAIGYLFWRHVVAIEPTRHPLPPGVRLLYLILAVPVDTFTGLALTMTSHEPFPALQQLHRSWGPSLLTDLHVGGVVMWVGGDTLMAIAMAPVAVLLVRDEERKAVEIDRQIEAALASSGRSANGDDREE